MDNKSLLEISNFQNDSEKINGIIKYLHEITAILTHFKDEIEMLKSVNKQTDEAVTNNPTLLGNVNSLLQIHSETLNIFNDHILTHDKHLENLGQHLEAHDDHLEAHDKHFGVLNKRHN